jgi:predicted amidohydrolase
MRVASVQMQPTHGPAAGNLDQILRQAAACAEAGAELALFPECCLQGYIYHAERDALAVAEDPEGAACSRLAAAASQLGIAIVCGFLERRARDRYSNSVLAALPGQPPVVYQKAHLPMLGADRWAQPGGYAAGSFGFRGIAFGLQICYDLRFPEPARMLALAGCDVILLATNWPEGYQATADHAARTRAWENRCWLVAANRIGAEGGTTFIGRSAVIDPLGRVAAQAGPDRPEVLIADIDPATARDKSLPGHAGQTYDFFASRRPELYAANPPSGASPGSRRSCTARRAPHAGRRAGATHPNAETESEKNVTTLSTSNTSSEPVIRDEAMRALIATASEIQSTAPTWDSGWSAHEVLAHVAASAQERANLIEEHLTGQSARPTRTFEEREPPFRAMPHRDLLERLIIEAARFEAAVSALTPDDEIEYFGWHVTADRLRFHSHSEASLHRWDLVGDDPTSMRLLSDAKLATHALVVFASLPDLLPEAQRWVNAPFTRQPARFRVPGQPDILITPGRGLSIAEPAGDCPAIELSNHERALVLWGRCPARLRHPGRNAETIDDILARIIDDQT